MLVYFREEVRILLWWIGLVLDLMIISIKKIQSLIFELLINDRDELF